MIIIITSYYTTKYLFEQLTVKASPNTEITTIIITIITTTIPDIFSKDNRPANTVPSQKSLFYYCCSSYYCSSYYYYCCYYYRYYYSFSGVN